FNVLASGPNAFTGKVDLTSTGALTSSPVVSASFTAGVLASQSLTITNTGSFTITATDHAGTGKTGTSNAFSVTAGALDHFTVTSTLGVVIADQIARTALTFPTRPSSDLFNVLASGPNAFTGKV